MLPIVFDERGWVLLLLETLPFKTDTNIDQLTLFWALILTMRFHALAVSCVWLERLTCQIPTVDIISWLFGASSTLSTENPRWKNGMTLFVDHFTPNHELFDLLKMWLLPPSILNLPVVRLRGLVQVQHWYYDPRTWYDLVAIEHKWSWCNWKDHSWVYRVMTLSNPWPNRA